MDIADILTLDSVKVPLDATTKREAIDELVDLLAAAGRIEGPARLKEVVWEREQQRSTGIGEGLAIPHGKCACSDGLVMAIGRPAEPMDFGSIDMRPVQLVVLLASPTDRTADHIQALGKISRMMSNQAFRRATFEAESAEALYELVRRGTLG